MILPPEYSWLDFYLENDSLWLEDALSWDEVFDLCLTDLTVVNALFTSSFFNNFIFTDSIVKLSFLDVILLSETDKYNFSKELYDFFIWDIVLFFNVKTFILNFIFFTDYQDFISIILYYSPEVILALNDYINIYWTSYSMSYNTASVYDLFNDILNLSISEFVEYFIIFYFYIWLIVIFINVFNLLTWTSSNDTYILRLYIYFFSVTKEIRLQFEATLQVVFFIFFYWTAMVATFDDDQEELIEVFDIGCFFFFSLMVIYLLYKYSQHYFAFLEASVSEGRTLKYVTKQFSRDLINTLALLLRTFTLLFRLNVYDTLDDFYDSYYIYVGDFDDDEYFDELFFSVNSLMFYDYDVNDDRIYSLEEENDFSFDLFYIYFMCWSKFFMFIFFIVEEILRLSLAFYICYLILFEVHAVNCSYVEDNYFYKKK